MQNDPRFENPSAADEGLLSCASVPLKIGGRIIGTLDIHSKKEQFAFNEGHIQVLNMLASQAAIAIENARLYEKNQRAKDELETRVKERTSELASVNALLSAIIEAAPTAIFDLDLNGKVNTIWNPAAERILGWKREEVIGKELPSVPNEKKKEFAEFRSQIRSGNIIDGIEVQCQKRDGTPIDYCIYASPLKDAENIIHGNVAVLMDITERKKHEREIAQMNRTLRMLSNSNQVLIHSSDEKSMYEEICRNITITAGYTLAWVGLVDQENQETLIPVAQVSQHEEISEYIFKYWQEANADDNLFIKSAQTGRAIINYDLQSDSTSPLIRDTAIQHGYSSVIALPIINEGNTLGVLGIFSAETDVFHAKEVEILKELANDLAFGVSSFRARIRKLQAEEDLRASEERFYAVFRYSPVAIAIVRAENGNIVDVNDTFITTSGYSREELIGHTTNELSLYRNPADRDHILQMLHEKGSIDSFEFDVRIKSGEIKSVISAITFIDIKDERHYLILMLDITRRKKSEEQLHLLSKALEATANSILITNRDAIIIWANNAFSKLSGYSLDEVIGKNPRDLVYSGIHSKDYYQHMWQTILSGNEWQGEIINKRKDNSIYNEFLTITPVRDEKNEIRHFIAVKQDITSQKMAEEELRTAKDKAEESNRLKNAFLATMNHELRTPLNHIIGFSDLMSSGSLLDNIPQYASIIYTSSKNLLEIIEDIFELALAEQSELKLRLQTFKCLDLFLNNKSSLTEILETSGKTEQIELVFNADQELLIQNVTADRTKINQVLGNLFKNAVKFTKSGKIEFGLKKGEPDWLNFYVKDTGIGIPEDKREIIFEFFRQLDDSDTREYGGVGIGLAISQRIVEVMKGSLTVESVPGEGSTFYFRIPVIMQSQDTKFIDTDKDLMIPDLEGKSFIIAEDDPVSTELIKNYLLPTGVKIVTVSNGKEVIENLSINPSLILMDLNMPVMDGYSATRKVKLKRPEIPVIAITAYALPTDQKKAKNAGCDGIISKPVDKHLLFEELKKHLGIE